jgi:hypothetical protein
MYMYINFINDNFMNFDTKNIKIGQEVPMFGSPNGPLLC